MTSINFNMAANAALRTMGRVQSELNTAQQRVSSGFRVGSAQDDAAYWSIATTMESDHSGLIAVKEALGLGSATVDVAYTGTKNAIKVVDEIKAKLIAAREPGLDRSKIQADISALQKQLVTIGDAAGFSGQNWLKIDSSAGSDIVKNIVSSVSRNATGIAVSSINVNVYEAATGTTTAMFDENATSSAKVGMLDREITAASGATFTVSNLDISALTDSPADLADLDSMVSGADNAILDLTASATVFGSARSRIELQIGFINDVTTAFKAGISGLVDADMNEESTRMMALQTKQSLAIQSLSIANSSSRAMLSLFQ